MDRSRRSRYGVGEDADGGWFVIYDLMAALARIILPLASLFHRKLRASLRGRRGGVRSWRIAPFDDRPALLLHVASRGEYESVYPLLERLNAEAKTRIAISFSSPSVEKPIMEREGLWAAGYLPFDTYGEQLRFLSRLEPKLILVSKHDIWPNMARAAATLGIPFIIANANFHSRTKRTLPLVRSFNRSFMRFVTAVWAVSKEDATRAKAFLPDTTALEALGDSRYDQCLRRAEEGRRQFNPLKEALGSGPVVVGGSVWPPDEAIIWPAFSALRGKIPAAKLLIAPHELGDDAWRRNQTAASGRNMTIRKHSDWSGGPIEEDVLYLDRMGVLAGIYAIGWAAVVGGGFGVGVHSVLEPAAHGLPVAFGPRCHMSNEAGLLLKEGGGIIINQADDLITLWLDWVAHPENHQTAAAAALGVAASRAGATDRILERIKPYLGLSQSADTDSTPV